MSSPFVFNISLLLVSFENVCYLVDQKCLMSLLDQMVCKATSPMTCDLSDLRPFSLVKSSLPVALSIPDKSLIIIACIRAFSPLHFAVFEGEPCFVVSS